MTAEGRGLGEGSIATRTPTERFVAVPKVGADATLPADAPLLRSPPERRRRILLELQGAHPGERFSVQQAATLEFEERALRELFSLALRDPLTRLYNAWYFAERLLGELALTQRQGTTLAVVPLDIDQLKTLNAQRGHQVGDAVLKLVLAVARLAVAAAKRQGANRIATAPSTVPASEHP